jgi:putative transposase
MNKTRRNVEEIIQILREADGAESNEEVCRRHGIAAPTFYRWKSRYGGMEPKEAQRLRDLELENIELKKLLADQMLKTKALETALEETDLEHNL